MDHEADIVALGRRKSVAECACPNCRLITALCDEVERLRSGSTDAVIQQIQIMQEKHPGQRIELSIEPDGYCYVTRSDRNGNVQPIAEGATLGDVFDVE